MFSLRTAGGKFEDEFAALNKVTKHYQELNFQDAYQILSAELERSGERIEFLGLKFPERVISTWGTAIIVVIQVYFWLHLRTFHARMTPTDPGLNLAWIGLYPDLLPRIVSVVSASALPSGVAFCLVIQSGWSPWILALWILGLLPSCGSFKLIADLNKLIKWRVVFQICTFTRMYAMLPSVS